MTQARHPVFARLYRWLIAPQITRHGGSALRGRLLADLQGTVLEVGAGEGSNFRHYPHEVERVLALEPEEYLREQARRVAVRGPGVEVLDASAEAVPLPDDSVDAVVFCLVLCSVPDQARALAEARRVLRPGGELRILEHVRAPEPGRRRRAQELLDATIWPHLFGGCHCARDTVGAVESAGFRFTEREDFRFPDGSRGPQATTVLGRAHLGV